MSASGAEQVGQLGVGETCFFACCIVERWLEFGGVVALNQFAIKADRIQAALLTQPAVPMVANGDMAHFVAQDHIQNFDRF